MRRIAALFLILCLLLSGCGGNSEELVIETQKVETVCAATESPAEQTVLPETQPATLPTTAPTEAPTEEPTEEPTEAPTGEPTVEPQVLEGQDYVLNKNSKKFHYPHCGSVKQMKEKNRKAFYGTREDVLSMGYVPCKNCHP